MIQDLPAGSGVLCVAWWRIAQGCPRLDGNPHAGLHLRWAEPGLLSTASPELSNVLPGLGDKALGGN